MLVCLRVDGRLASSGVAGVTSGAGVAGVGVGVAALLQKKDMKRKSRNWLNNSYNVKLAISFDAAAKYILGHLLVHPRVPPRSLDPGSGR